MEVVCSRAPSAPRTADRSVRQDIVFGVHAGGGVGITVEQRRVRQIAQFDGNFRWPGICAWWSARSHFGEVAIDML